MKKKVIIKTLFTLIVTLCVSIVLNGQEVQSYSFDHNGNGLQITGQTRGGVSLGYSIDRIDLSSFSYKDETMHSISVSGISIPNEKGMPNVPNFSRFIAIPQGAEAVMKIKSYEQQIIKDVNIEPSLGIQAENEKPNSDYVKNEKVYSEDKFYPEKFAAVSTPTSLRGVDIVAVEISPVRYNPVTKEAIVYHNIELEVEFVGGNGQFGENRLRSPYWDPILEQNILNYNSLPVIDYEKRMQAWLNNRSVGYEYVIVTPNNDDWAEAANSLKEYRLSQGIITEVMRLDEMGVSTTDQMKTWFHNAYNTWDIAPVAFLLFGDHNTNMTLGIPAETVSHPYEGSCISDNQYADVTGDYLPDMVFSRLIAADGTEAAMMASKQIEYEYTNPNMDPSSYQSPVTALGWQTERWFQLCSEVVGGYFRSKGKTPQRINCIYDGTPGSSWSSATNTSTVVNYFGPSGRNYIPSTPSELGGWTGGTPAQIVDAINAGTMLVQHRDHGYELGWGEPNFNNSHVSQLTNVGKMPFIMSINCLTGKYNYSSTCFAEAFMRRTYNGQNAGAVGLLCPTEVSYSFVNDVFVWGVYDQFQPDFLPDYGPYASTEGNWHPAFGNVAGKYFLAQSAWPYNTSSKQITYQMFTAHCDAFLRLYSEVPQTIEAWHQEVILSGTTSLQLSAPVGTTIAISKETLNGTELLAVANATGSIQDVEIPVQQPSTILQLVITGQNYLRYVDDIEVIAQDGPYVIFNSYNINNENGQLNSGESAGMDITLKNVGTETANNITATLTSSSEFVSITNNVATVNAITAGDTYEIENQFIVNVADNIPDGTHVVFTMTCVSGGETWTSNFDVVAHAPEFEFVSINTQEGNIMPGQNGHMVIVVKNTGSATANDANLSISSSSSKLSFETTSVEIPEMIPNETYEISATFHASSSIPLGTTYYVNYSLESGQYYVEETKPIMIGIFTEDFETGDFSSYNWEFNSYPWTITSANAHGGTYSAKSTNTNNSSNGTMSVTMDITSEGEISFYYKVSSENNYDKLYFYVDDVSQGYWSGTIDWTQFSTEVTAGIHTFMWKYYKDGSVSSGSDCVWVDDIEFPPIYVEIPLQPVSNIQANIIGYQVDLSWTGVEDATQYLVSRDGIEIAEVTEEGYFEALAEPGTYTYSVVATDGFRFSEPVSTVVTIEPFEMHWQADPYVFAENMTVTSVIQIEGVEQFVNTLEVGAFCGDDCRGSQVGQYFPPTGRYIVNLMIYGEQDDVITFRIYDHVRDMELVLSCENVLTFEPNVMHGGLTNPYIINFDNLVNHCTTLVTGNNWYSTYVEIDGTEGLDFMKAGVASSATMIKSQTQYTTYYEGYGWYGNLSTANNEEMYLVDMTEDRDLCIAGSKADPAEHSITLHQQWNWIGYPVSQIISVNNALAGIANSSGDILKSQFGYTTYYEGYGWYGTLNYMNPGQGYMFLQSADITQQLVYPSTRNVNDVVKANITADNNHWCPNAYKYATNMGVTAVISIGGEIQTSENLEVAVFCNGEIRGSARPLYFEPLNEYVVMLTIYGNNGDELSFKLFDVENNFEYQTVAKETFEYAADAIIGELGNPFVLNFAKTDGIGENEINDIEFYPNPTQCGETILMDRTCEIVEVFNVVGIKIAEYQNVDKLRGFDVAGSYIVRITNGSNVTYGKIVVR